MKKHKDDTPYGIILCFQLLLIAVLISSCVGEWLDRGAPNW